MSGLALGIDISGTFTDIVSYDHDSGRQVIRKVLTTHDDPARAVGAGVAALLRRGGSDSAASRAFSACHAASWTACHGVLHHLRT